MTTAALVCPRCRGVAPEVERAEGVHMHRCEACGFEVWESFSDRADRVRDERRTA